MPKRRNYDGIDGERKIVRDDSLDQEKISRSGRLVERVKRRYTRELTEREKKDRRTLIKVALGLGLMAGSGAAGLYALLNPSKPNPITGEAVKQPVVENKIAAELSPEELEIVNAAINDFYRTYGVAGVYLELLDNQFDDGVEVYASPSELILDIEQIKQSASESNLTVEEYLRFIILGNMSATLQIPGSREIEGEFFLRTGFMKEYKGFGVNLVDREGGLSSLSSVEISFRDAFASVVDGEYLDVSQNAEGILLAGKLLQSSGISINQALELNKNHSFYEFLGSITGVDQPLVEDVDFVIGLFDRALVGENADALFEEFQTKFSKES